MPSSCSGWPCRARPTSASPGALIEPVHAFGLAFTIRIVAFAGVAILISLLRERQLALERSAEELGAIRAALTPSALPRLPGIAAAAFVPSE